MKIKQDYKPIGDPTLTRLMVKVGWVMVIVYLALGMMA